MIHNHEISTKIIPELKFLCLICSKFFMSDCEIYTHVICLTQQIAKITLYKKFLCLQYSYLICFKQQFFIDIAIKFLSMYSPNICEVVFFYITGAPPPPMFSFPPEQEDTPRTYRSEASDAPPKPTHKTSDNAILSTKNTIEYLKKSFSYFNRAIVSLM